MNRMFSVLIAGLLLAMLPVAPALAAAPTVTGVSSPTAAGSYKVGSPDIEIQVQFSEIVNVTGVPTLQLETGTTDRILNYSSGSGTNTLKFYYTISTTTSNDASLDLDYAATTSLAHAGGSTIKNATNQDAVLTLRAPGTAGSLGANNAIIIDTTAPKDIKVYYLTYNTANTLGASTDVFYNEGQTLSTFSGIIPIKVLFTAASEKVYVTGTPTLELETGAIDRLATYVSGSGTNTLTFNYLVTSGDTSADLNYKATNSLALNGGTIRDAAGNDATLTLGTLTASWALAHEDRIFIDTTPPTAPTIATQTILVRGTANVVGQSNEKSEYVAMNGSLVVGAGLVLVKNNNTPTSWAQIMAIPQSASTFGERTSVYPVSSANTDEPLSVVWLVNGVYKLYAVDSVGNISAPSTNSVTVSDMSPTVTGVSSPTAAGSYKVGSPDIEIQVQFSEIVNVTGVPTLELETGTTDRILNYSSGSGTNTLKFYYTISTTTSNDTSADLDYTATTSLAHAGGSTIKNATNQDAVLTLRAPGTAGSLGANNAIIIDTTAPTIFGSNSLAESGFYSERLFGNTFITTNSPFSTFSGALPIYVQFREGVVVTGTPTLELETGAIDRLANYVSGSGTDTLTFNYLVTSGDTSADLDQKATDSLALNGGTIRDAAGNNAILTLRSDDSLGLNKAFVIDTTPPTASVTTQTIVVSGTANVVGQSSESSMDGASVVPPSGLYLVRDNYRPTSWAQLSAIESLNTALPQRSSVTKVLTANIDITTLSTTYLVNGVYKLYALDKAGNISAPSTNSVTIARLSPTVSMLPQSGVISTASRIAVQSTMTGKAYLVRDSVVVANVASITGSGDVNYNEVTISTADTATSMATSTLSVGTYKLYAASASFNLSTPFPTLVTIGTDSSAPTVSTATPFPGETQAAVAASLVLRFNEPIAKFTTDSSKTISLVRSVVPTITTGSLTANVATLTFSSAPGFIVGDKITTTSCSNVVYDNAASAITVVSGSTISFAKTNVDVVSAAITGCAYTATKTNGITNLITTSEIIPSNNVRVVVGTFPNDNLVTIDPSGEMLFGVAYHVLISPGAIVDRATVANNYVGVPSATPQTWSFSTGTDTTAPTLSNSQSDPPNGMTTFTPSRNITLKFSESVVDVANKVIKLCTGAEACGTPVQTFTLQTSTASGGLVVVSESMVTLNPTADLNFSTTYFVLIDIGAFTDGATPPNNYAGMATCSSHPCSYEFATAAAPVAGAAPVTSGAVGDAFLAPCVFNCFVQGPVLLPGMTAPIIGPAPTFGAGGVPLGNSLTAGNMAGVDPNIFRSFNPTQAGQIAPSAMAGFSSGQMAALPPSAMGGFNSSQMAALPPSAMGGMNSGQMAALPPSAMSGFNSSQMAALPPSAMGGFNSSQMSALPPSAMGGFNSSQMAALRPSAMGSFRPDQMSALPPSAMGGFNSSQMSALPPNAMTGFNSSQIAALPPSAMQGFNLGQMKVLPPSAISGLQQNQFAALPPSAMIGFKPDQFAALGASAISGMQQNQFKAIPAAAMGAFTPTQMDAMPVSALSVITPSQFKSLTSAVIASMSPEQRSALPKQALNAAANLAPANTGNAAALAGALTGWNIDKVPANAFNNFKPADAAKLSPETFSAMNPEQFKAMPDTAFAGFKPDQVGALTPQVFAGMKPTQLASMPNNAFSSFNSEQVAALPAAAFGAMKPTQVGAMSPTLMSTMTPQQVGALPPAAMAGLKADQVDALPPTAFASMKPGAVGALSTAAVGSLNVEQVGALPAAAFGAMKPTQVGALPPAAMATMTPQQVGALPPAAMSGLKADQVDALPPAAFATMKPAAVAAFPPASAAGFSNEKLAAMTPAQEKALKPAFVNKLTPEQKAALKS